VDDHIHEGGLSERAAAANRDGGLRYISGAIRGTWWETRDFCDRSGVRVLEGTVTATNLVTGKKKAVPKGQIYSVPKP